jgi:hypothetical protein
LDGNTINAFEEDLKDDNDGDMEDDEATTAGVLLLLLPAVNDNVDVDVDVEVVVDAIDEEDSLDFIQLLRRGGGECASSSGSTGFAMMMGDW